MTDVTKFIDKETGNIHVGEVVIGRDLKWEDAEKLAPYAEIDGDEEIRCIVMNEMLEAAGIPARVEASVFSDEWRMENGPMITLMCYPPAEAYLPGIEQNYVWLEAGKKWLKAVLGEPNSEYEHAIGYQYDWGRVSICVMRDGHNDLRGGEIEIWYGRKE